MILSKNAIDFLCGEITSLLKPFKYNWPLPEKCPPAVDAEAYEKLLDRQNKKTAKDKNADCYEEQKELKLLVSKALNGSFSNVEMNEWIVKVWGGIKGFVASKNIDKIEQFSSGLKSGKVSLQNIASYSKVASFVDPLRYFIYDSRVTVTINALLLRYFESCKNSGEALKFFPMPQSRGGREVYMSEIIFEKAGTSAEAYDDKVAYCEYCELIAALAKRLGLSSEPFKLEMLLFMLAETDGVVEKEWFPEIQSKSRAVKKFSL